MNALERVTILAYTDCGDTPFVALSPEYFKKAQTIVQRLLNCGLDPSDFLYPSMPSSERRQILALVQRLRHYVALGVVQFVHPPETTL